MLKASSASPHSLAGGMIGFFPAHPSATSATASAPRRRRRMVAATVLEASPAVNSKCGCRRDHLLAQTLCGGAVDQRRDQRERELDRRPRAAARDDGPVGDHGVRPVGGSRLRELRGDRRSEEHTSELQSRSDLVCRLLLEKKNNK